LTAIKIQFDGVGGWLVDLAFTRLIQSRIAFSSNQL